MCIQQVIADDGGKYMCRTAKLRRSKHDDLTTQYTHLRHCAATEQLAELADDACQCGAPCGMLWGM